MFCLLRQFLRLWCAGASDGGVAASLVGLFGLAIQVKVVAAGGARGLIEHRLIGCRLWWSRIWCAHLDLLVLRHADEPIQDESTEDVENDVDPKDAANIRSVVLQEYDGKRLTYPKLRQASLYLDEMFFRKVLVSLTVQKLQSAVALGFCTEPPLAAMYEAM